MSELKKLSDLIKKHQHEFEKIIDEVIYHLGKEDEEEYLRTTSLSNNTHILYAGQTAIKIYKHNNDIELPPMAIRIIGYAVRMSALALRKLDSSDMLKLNEIGNDIIERHFVSSQRKFVSSFIA